MRSWIGLHHPLLALEAFQPRWCDPGTQVVIDHDRVWAMSATAEYNGIRIGMRHGGVAMLCPDATIFYRARQRSILPRVLCGWAIPAGLKIRAAP